MSILLWAILPLFASANTEAPQVFTYEGRLYDTNENPIAETVDFKLQIYNEAEDCLLYEETQTLDLSSTEGRFAVEVGSVTGSTKRTTDDPGFAMWQVFKNTGSLAVPACAGGVYNPALGEKRKLQVTITPSGTGIAEILTPNQTITSAPSAMMSQSLQGVGKDGFVQATGNITQTIVDDLSGKHTELMALANGTSTDYIQAGGSVGSNLIYANDQIAVGTSTPATGVELEIQKDDPTFRLEATDATGGTMAIQFFDTSGTDQAQIMSTEGTNGLTITTGGTTALTIDGSQNANFAGSVTVSGTIQGGVYTNADEGTVLTPALTTCGAGCAGTQWMNSDLQELRYWDGAAIRSVGSYSGAEAAGQVLTSNGAGNAPTWQAVDDTTKLPLAGGTMNGAINMDARQINNLAGPTVGGDAVNKSYADGNILGLPLAAPTGTEDMQTIRWNNTAGNWEYFTPSGGSVSAVTGTAPIASSGGATPAISLNFADGLTNNAGNLEVNLSSDLTFNAGAIEIATDGVTSAHILDGTIDTIDLADTSVTLAKLADEGGALQSIRRNSADTAFEYYTPLDNTTAFVNGGNTFGADATLGTNDNFALNFETNNSTAMTIDTSGNVGIGTTAPGSLLTIESATTNRPWIHLNNTSMDNRNSGITFTGTSGGVTSNYQIFQWSAGQNLAISSDLTGGSGNIARFHGASGDVSIDNGELLSYGAGDNYFAGKIGVATPTPARTLHIAGTDGMRLAPSVLPGTPAAGDIAIDSGDSNQLKYYDGSSWIEVMNAAGDAGGDLLDGGNSTGATVVVGTNDSQSLQLETNNAPAVTIDSSGSVGIGTTTPAAKLDVNGTIKATSFIGASNSLTFHVNSSTGSDANDGLSSGSAFATIKKAVDSIPTGGNGRIRLVSGQTYTINSAINIYDKTVLFREQPASPITIEMNAAINLHGTSYLMISVGSSTGSPSSTLVANVQYPIVVNSGSSVVTIGGYTAMDIQMTVDNSALVRTHYDYHGKAVVNLLKGQMTLSGAVTQAYLVYQNLAGEVSVDSWQYGLPGANFAISNLAYNRWSGNTMAYGNVSRFEISAGDSGQSFGSNSGLAIENASTASNNYPLQIATGSGKIFNITSAGDVGIGTTSPTEMLDVNGNVKAAAFYGDGSNLTNLSAANSSNAGNVVINADSDSAGGGEIQLQTQGTTRAVIDNNGNLGVGVTSGLPAKISLASGTTAADGIAFGSDVTLYRSAADVLKTDDSLAVGTQLLTDVVKSLDSSKFMLVGSGSDLSIGGSSGSGQYDDVIFDNSGNVGIGTTGPTSPLHVVGTADIDNLRLSGNTISSTDVNGAITISPSNTDIDIAGNDLTILNQGGGRNADTGDVLIGTGDSTNYKSGDVNIFTGDATSNDGGDILIDAGDSIYSGGAARVGGSITLTAGNAVSAVNNNKYGGSITLQAGYNSGDLPRHGNINFEYYDGTAYRSGLRFDGQTGNVGIGTTSPSELLDLKGDGTNGSMIEFENGANRVGNFGAFGSDSSTLSLNRDMGGTRNFRLYDGTANLMLQADGANQFIGIGTATPDTKLHVNGAIKIADGGEACAAAGDAGRIRYNGGILYYCNGATWETMGTESSGDTDYVNVSGDTMTGALNLPANGLIAGTDQFVLSGGKVAVGTTSPVTYLTVGGSISGANRAWMNYGLTVGKPGDSDGGYFGIKDEGTNNLDTVIAWGDDLGDDFRFIFNASGGPLDGAEIMRLTGSGNVGIGTSAPQSILHVEGSSPTLSLRNSSANDSKIVLQNSTPTDILKLEAKADATTQISSYGYMTLEASGASSQMHFNTGGASRRMTIDQVGNVGIGTNNPDTKLHVNGAIKIADGGEACAAAGDAGRIRYNGGILYYCNGATWETVTTNSSGDTDYVNVSGDTMSGPLSVDITQTATTGHQSGFQSLVSAEPSSPESFGPWGAHDPAHVGIRTYVTSPVTSANAINQMLGSQSAVEYFGTGTVNYIQGTEGWAYNATADINSSIRGVLGAAQTEGGTVPEIMGVRSWSGVTGGTVTDQIGLHVSLSTSNVTVTNRYGIFLQAPTGSGGGATNDYGIYQAGTQTNYFGGKVGIGTTSPWAKLDVQHSDSATPSWADSAGYFDLNLSGSTTGYTGGSTLSLKATSSATSSAGSGNVEAFGADITVVAANDGAEQRVAGIYTGIETHPGDVGYGMQIDNQYQGNSTGGTAYGVFINMRDADVTRYGIYQKSATNNYFAGNIGIGETNPQATLHLKTETSGNLDGIIIENDVSPNPNTDGPYVTFQYDEEGSSPVESGDTIGGMRFRSSYASGTYSGYGASIKAMQDGSASVSSSPGALIFSTTANGTTTLSERMRISNTGNVGIGTTSPSRIFHVHGGIDYGMVHLTNNTTGTTGSDGLALYNSGVNAFLNNYENGNFYFYNNNAVAMTILPSGNVGVGITNPSHKLHVIGTAGLSTGTAWTNTSDIRLKDVHGDYDYGLQEILKLRTVRFNYKKDNPLGLPADQEIVGFIAQEVQDVIPEAVVTREDGYLELNVDPIHWATVNAVQEVYGLCEMSQEQLETLAQRVNQHDRDIASLKEENESLKKENTAIKAWICGKDPHAPFCQD